MDVKTIRNSKIYGEMSREVADDWFLYSREKFISHIDTFYYSVKTVGLWNESKSAINLVADLKAIKESAEEDKEEKPFMPDDELVSDLVVRPFFGFRMYRFGLTKADCFDIFIAEKVADPQMSTIIVQLRSQFLWLHGVKDAFYESLVYLYTVLDKYGVKVSDITENRIDYAYHTNYIQNMLSFFRDENLGEMQVSSFKRWGKEGCFNSSGIEADYITLGRRASNNAFVRIYNKSKEVIEKGYKQFFVPLWLEQGMISKFDKYIFDHVFDDGKISWNYKDVVRCHFYLEYGSDQNIILEIKQLMQNPIASAEDYKKLADLCVPDLTNITNIEIQTKRKFYYNFRMPEIDYPKWVPLCEKRIYLVFNMLQSFRDFITYDTIRFVNFKGKFKDVRRERRPLADWWIKLAACGELDGISYNLCKEYQRRYDFQRTKNRSINSIALMASLVDDRTDDDLDYSLDEELIDLISYFNDNDMQKYNTVRKKRHKEVRAKFD